MNAPFYRKSAPPAPPAPGELFPIIPQFIDRRELIDEDGDPSFGSIVRVGFSKADKSRLHAERIEIEREEDDPLIELHQQLEVTVTGHHVEPWGNYLAVIIEGTATIVPFEPSTHVKVDAIAAADCRSLEKRFGLDYAVKIAADPDLMLETKFSLEKRAMIVLACKAEKDAAEGDTAFTKKIMALYCAVGISKGKARALAARFVKRGNIYQHLFAGWLSFKEGIRFAHLFDPVRAEKDRPLAIVINEFLDTESVVVGREGKDGLDAQTYKNFGVGLHKITAALERLIKLGVIKEDGGMYGLTRLVKAEQSVASVLLKNQPIKLSADVEAVIEYVLDNAGDFIGRPVTLDPEQRDGVSQVFRNKFSVITGGPGVGKTLDCALISVIACMIYPLEAEQLPAVGMALAGTAADNLRQTTVCVWRDRVVALPAGTIHKLLHMEPSDDDIYEPNAAIDCGVLIIDETSMISSSLLNVILKNSNAKHVVFVGDGDQLPPIGAGKPFRDMIASDKVPVTRLVKNHRTECAGIRGVCDDILLGQLSSESVKRHEGEGGFAFHYSDKPAKAFVAAELYADFADGRDLYDIAILTPFNQGDGGTRAINIEVRKALGRPEYVAKGDLILVTKNNYKAVRPDEPNHDNPEYVTIFNGERCKVIKVGRDFIDLEFPKDAWGYIRRVRSLMTGDWLPPGFEYGYAFSVHKAQSKQFPIVIVVTERSSKMFGIVQRSSIYTACSRAREQLVVIGSLDEFIEAAKTPEKKRNTLLEQLLTGKSYRVPAVVEVGARVAWFGRDPCEGEILSIVGDLIVVRDDRDGFKLKLPTKLHGAPNPFLKTVVIREALHG